MALDAASGAVLKEMTIGQVFASVLVCLPQPRTIGGRYSGRLPQVLAPELHQFHPRALGLFDFRLLHRGCGELELERFPF
jgi:hypothetical protein